MFRQPKYTGPERRQRPRWRPRPFRVLLALLIIAAVGYTGVVVWLMSQETRLVFEAGATLAPTRPPFPYTQVDLPHHDGTQQFAWVMQQQGSDEGTWVLFLHGNAATIASRVNIARYAGLRNLGVNVLAPEYRGFAGLDGIPTESSLNADARAAYSYLLARRIDPARIVVYGWSLGSAVAVDLASKVDEAAVVVEGAPASLVDIGSARYPFFPIRLLMRNPFDSVSKVKRIHAPMLFLHSPEDTVIPIAEGKRLYEAAHTDKTFVEVRGGHVKSADDDPERFFGAIRTFLAQHHLIEAAIRPESNQRPSE
jgi:pimeloyl-ACP methyl ester carboxylesterase